MRNVNTQIMTGADASTNQSSAKVDSQSIFACSAQVIATGAPVGAVQFQASNDISIAQDHASTFTPTNWTNIGTSTPVSAAGVVMLQKIDSSYRWLRVIYTFTSGTGTVTVNFNGLAY